MSATHLFNAIFTVSLVTTLLTLIASVGVTISVRQILRPVRRVWLVADRKPAPAAEAPAAAGVPPTTAAPRRRHDRQAPPHARS